jgi:hypothetical protein
MVEAQKRNQEENLDKLPSLCPFTRKTLIPECCICHRIRILMKTFLPRSSILTICQILMHSSNILPTFGPSETFYTSLASMPSEVMTGVASSSAANEEVLTEIYQAIRNAAPSPNEKLVRFVGQFLEDHHISRGILPFDTRAGYILVDQLPNIDRRALYLLVTWKEETTSRSNIVSVSSMVKYWTEDEDKDDDNRLALIIHYHPVFDSVGVVVNDSCYEWFSYQNFRHSPRSSSLKDLLVVGKAVSGMLPTERPAQLILFHEE